VTFETTLGALAAAVLGGVGLAFFRAMEMGGAIVPAFCDRAAGDPDYRHRAFAFDLSRGAIGSAGLRFSRCLFPILSNTALGLPLPTAISSISLNFIAQRAGKR